MSEIDPFETLRQISEIYCLSRSIHELAELNVADALGDEPLSATELARKRHWQNKPESRPAAFIPFNHD
jgi:hypothetical protein